MRVIHDGCFFDLQDMVRENNCYEDLKAYLANFGEDCFQLTRVDPAAKARNMKIVTGVSTSVGASIVINNIRTTSNWAYPPSLASPLRLGDLDLLPRLGGEPLRGGVPPRSRSR